MMDYHTYFRVVALKVRHGAIENGSCLDSYTNFFFFFFFFLLEKITSGFPLVFL